MSVVSLRSFAYRRWRDAESYLLDPEAYAADHGDLDGAVPGGVRAHYRTEGHGQGRAIRWRTPLAAFSASCICAVPRDHWSGVRLQVKGQGRDGWTLTVVVLDLTGRRPRVVRRKSEPCAAIDPAYPHFIRWTPIAGSAGRRYAVLLRQTRRGGRGGTPPLALGFAPDWDLQFSSPEVKSDFPSALLVSPVTQCNLNCIHCISRHSRRRVSEMTEGVWAQIEAAARTNRLGYVQSDYSGDLLFSSRKHSDWLARMIALDVPFKIDTHANDLTPDVTERLLASKLSEINFSIDSFDADDYPRIRRGAKPLATVLDNIARFMKSARSSRPDLKTSVSLVLMQRNLAQIEPALAFAEEHGITFVYGNHLHAYTEDMVEESLLLTPGRYADMHARVMAMAERMDVTLCLPGPDASLVARDGHPGCGVPWSSLTVLGNGDVMACCVPGTKVGHLSQGSLAEIWTGDAMRAFRAAVSSDAPPGPCRTCPMARHPNNFASYVPGLPKPAQDAFVARCLKANAALMEARGRGPGA